MSYKELKDDPVVAAAWLLYEAIGKNYLLEEDEADEFSVGILVDIIKTAITATTPDSPYLSTHK